MKTLLIPVLLLALSFPALAKDDKDKDKGYKGAPGPVVGAGLPLLLIAGGIYWIVRRRKNAA